MNVNTLHTGLQSLVILRNILKDPVIGALDRYLAAPDELGQERIGLYCEFVTVLYSKTEQFSRYLLELILEDENLYVTRYCAGMKHRADREASAGDVSDGACNDGWGAMSPCLENCLSHELAFLQQLSQVDSVWLTAHLDYDGYLPLYLTEELEFDRLFRERLAQIHIHGYGMFARHYTFTVSDGKPVPVKHPDPQTLEELPGYERERAKVIANTEALLAGQPACNVLLYGDAGTGKSSAVKAIANSFYDKGLRLIEVKKNQLYQIPQLVDELGKNPLKFILFVDDLSFNANDDNFSALKAILEGSVSGRSSNVAVYATSNRRHLVKETMTDREGDDIHFFDTMQEMMSLSARFGLTVTFTKPDKDKYLSIVHVLAKFHGVTLEEEKLDVRAEAHAIRSGGRSPRVAKQFVELLAAGVLEA